MEVFGGQEVSRPGGRLGRGHVEGPTKQKNLRSNGRRKEGKDTNSMLGVDFIKKEVNRFRQN